ncbi:MerR family transcriptional regulator [Streptomyces sp. KL116D]|uniref:MerR family transcriptional regulator n=1 Tax=Streptomyces sp. KL116D TaxID=3045152 RepID=UPI0035580F2B
MRHYHRLGLVDEPERDRSGYRRYGSPDMVRLVQVRTLAGAGVPLVEIGGCSTPVPSARRRPGRRGAPAHRPDRGADRAAHGAAPARRG